MEIVMFVLLILFFMALKALGDFFSGVGQALSGLAKTLDETRD